ncbi:MAG: YicC family protein [Solibacterales bacterium]|nr:YicC family protein [Bryobacterales bacterium]
MPSSMTGYANAESDDDCLWLAVTLRSVNHRFLDLQLRLAPQIEQFETLIRRHVKEHLQRGQLQLSVLVRWKEESTTFALNRPLLDAYINAHRELTQRHGFSQEPDLSTILSIPNTLSFETETLSEQSRAKLQTILEETLDHALEELARSRKAEAVGIVEEIHQHTESMKSGLVALQDSFKNVIPQFQKRLVTQLTDLFSNIPTDSQRLMQEAALLAGRADISEEIHRLESHTDRLLVLVETESEIGKKIEFLTQEMHREANTILSKTNPLSSAALAVTEIGLELKSAIEKIREQAQNLE